MELDLFKSFVAVAEARSFSRAARTLHFTQPTVSRQIARLEKELGATLFERYGRHVECTITGQLLLPLAQAIVSRTEDAIALVREQAGSGSQDVRFGAVGNVMALLLTPVLGSFLAAYPTVSLYLSEKDDAQLEEAVISGELDCAVMTPWGSSRAATQHLITEEILLVVPQQSSPRASIDGASEHAGRGIDLAAAGHHECGQHRRRRSPPRGLRAQVLLPGQLP